MDQICIAISAMITIISRYDPVKFFRLNWGTRTVLGFLRHDRREERYIAEPPGWSHGPTQTAADSYTYAHTHNSVVEKILNWIVKMCAAMVVTVAT